MKRLSGLLLPGFRNVCRISADLNKLSGALERRTGNAGKVYWYLEFETCIRFGGTELEAYLEWKEHVSTSFYETIHPLIFLRELLEPDQ